MMRHFTLPTHSTALLELAPQYISLVGLSSLLFNVWMSLDTGIFVNHPEFEGCGIFRTTLCVVCEGSSQLQKYLTFVVDS